MNKTLFLSGICFLFFAEQFCLAANKLTDITTPEGIGKHLSELLIHRVDITKSPCAINVNRIFPDSDFSEFEDSPAMFILNLLYDSQLYLPHSWDNLLFSADSLNIDKDAKYLETFFTQTGERFTLICILISSSKYYAFSADVLIWKDSQYVMNIGNKLRKYNNIEELRENWNSDEWEENWESKDEESTIDFGADYSLEIVDSLNIKPYTHNQSYILPEIENTYITSLEHFMKDFISSIGLSTEYDPMNFFPTLDEFHKLFPEDEQQKMNGNDKQLVYEKNIKAIWADFIASLKEKEDYKIEYNRFQLNHIPWGERDLYYVDINYRVKKDESESFTFSVSAILFDRQGQWKLINISPLTEKTSFLF